MSHNEAPATGSLPKLLSNFDDAVPVGLWGQGDALDSLGFRYQMGENHHLLENTQMSSDHSQVNEDPSGQSSQGPAYSIGNPPDDEELCLIYNNCHGRGDESTDPIVEAGDSPSTHSKQTPRKSPCAPCGRQPFRPTSTSAGHSEGKGPSRSPSPPRRPPVTRTDRDDPVDRYTAILLSNQIVTVPILKAFTLLMDLVPQCERSDVRDFWSSHEVIIAEWKRESKLSILHSLLSKLRRSHEIAEAYIEGILDGRELAKSTQLTQALNKIQDITDNATTSYSLLANTHATALAQTAELANMVTNASESLASAVKAIEAVQLRYVAQETKPDPPPPAIQYIKPIASRPSASTPVREGSPSSSESSGPEPTTKAYVVSLQSDGTYISEGITVKVRDDRISAIDVKRHGFNDLACLTGTKGPLFRAILNRDLDVLHELGLRDPTWLSSIIRSGKTDIKSDLLATLRSIPPKQYQWQSVY